MDQLTATLLSAPVLFFILGGLAAAARSDLSVPETLAKGMSLYLMAAIGLKGGVEVAKAGIGTDLLGALAAGLALSAAIPFLVAPALSRFGGLDRINTGAVAAHYGSVSVVTFVTASQIYGSSGFAIAGFMVAVLAMMETPAILSGLLIARRESGKLISRELLREVLFNGSVVLLLGSFAIGMVIGEDGFEPISPLFRAGFTGVLCLFLLDMGLIAMRRILETRALTLRLAALGILFPVVNGTLGVLTGTLIGLDAPSAAALGILAASASYIAVPAAMRMSLPQADAGLYLAMSLGVTFPFNIVFGIPLLRGIAEFAGALL
ncbi:sodium-dependent bicarbonate transport family permease [Qipengyuania sp. GH1]|uniref:sodium-dependent bicarbonate transport family permease n=1 Tax=Qipengyuania aestuarii TaxID=2867241 RepID=UPI001C86F831|nr:sodium-dependent bicarbonate transport family permease [Qipengyuania aestuarii]MBX7535205.1 sodium-dependent bicarbonate transport family permease [Qipengyuania aestuarii]